MGVKGFYCRYFPFTIHQVKGDSEAAIRHHFSRLDKSFGLEPVEATEYRGEVGRVGRRDD